MNGSVDLADGDRIRVGGVPLIFRSALRAESTESVASGEVRASS